MRVGNLWQRIGVPTKVVAAGVLLTAVFSLTTFLWVLPNVEDTLLEKKKATLREETAIAWSVLAHHADLADRKVLTLEEAQSRAAAVIRDIKYGADNTGYFWINDLQPVMIMHPYRTDLIDKNVSEFRDPNGIELFVEMVEIARQRGAGYVHYSWQLAGDEANVVPKISYVQLFRPWNWIIGTGVYIEDLKAELSRWQTRIIAIYSLLTLAGIVFSWFVGTRVARLLKQREGRLASDDGSAADAALGTRVRGVRLKTFVLFVTVPTIILMTGVWCVLFYQDLRSTIVEGFDRKLYALSSITGCFIDGEEHTAIADGRHGESSAVYKKYVRPMQRIAKATNLSYLYSQVLLDEAPQCKYVLDATEGEDHTEIGFVDELPLEDYRGGQNVELYGAVHIGKIQATDEWGLIKVSYAPIYNADGTISAMAGADVDITKIDQQLKSSLFTICLAGIAVLLLAGYVSLVFSRRLTGPLTTLKDGALKIASGRYDQEIELRKPVELTRLATSFNGIGQRLKEQLQQTIHDNAEIDRNKTRNELIVTLDRGTRPEEEQSLAQLHVAHRGTLKNDKSASGWTGDQRLAVVWIITDAPADALEAVRLRNDIRLTCDRLLARHDGPLSGLAERLAATLPDEVDGFFVVDLEHDTTELYTRRELRALIIAADGEATVRSLSELSADLRVPGTQLLFTDFPELLSAPAVAGFERSRDSADSTTELASLAERLVNEAAGDRQVLLAVLQQPAGKRQLRGALERSGR